MPRVGLGKLAGFVDRADLVEEAELRGGDTAGEGPVAGDT